MRALTLSILENRSITSLPDCVEGGGLPALVSGLGPVHRAHLAAALSLRCGRPLCVIVPDDASSDVMAAALRSFLDGPVVTVTGREFTFYASESVSRQAEQKRLQALDALGQEEPPAAVITAGALLTRTVPPGQLSRCGEGRPWLPRS